MKKFLLFNLLVLFSFSALANSSVQIGSGRTDGIYKSFAIPSEQEFKAQTLVTPSEFAPAIELQMTAETFRRIERYVIGTVDQNTNFIVLVASQSEGSRLVSEFKNMGGNADRLKPVVMRFNSIWYQDYGPIYSISEDGQLVSNDFTYARFNRKLDDAVPSQLANLQGITNRAVTMNYEGGNFISDGRNGCFASRRIYEQNPQLTEAAVNELMRANLGCENMTILTPLVEDGTFHIDLFAKLVGEKTFIVGDFVDHARNKVIMDQNARMLEQMGYQVYRVPVRSPNRANYLSHINTFLVNGYALMPTYDIPEDRISKEAYERAGYKVLMIPAGDLQNTGGAIHCIMRSKPDLSALLH